MTDHSFGGAHTEVKLKIIKDYLSIYTNALKNQPFNLLYIDAFAGTGERVEVLQAAPIFGKEELKNKYRGSVQIALELQNAFDTYYFIEKDKKHFKKLEEIIGPYKESRSIHCYNDDANEVIPRICNEINWKYNRAVLFLDPYGMAVKWSILDIIKNTGAIDVWYLFPTFGAYRNISNTLEATEIYKQDKLTALFGTEDWKKYVFEAKKNSLSPEQSDIFNQHCHDDEVKAEKVVDLSGLETYTKMRFEESFPYVTKPVRLYSEKGIHAFSLFMLLSNSRPAAIALAKKVANHILKSS